MATKFREIAGKVAVITGAARGIGRGCAEAMAAEGVHVVLADILPEVSDAWNEIHAAYPDIQGFSMIVDVSKDEDVKALIDKTVQTFGRIDIMHNNAGINGGPMEITSANAEHINKIFQVNFNGFVFGCKYAAIQMKKQKSGTIVNTGSWYGKVGHAAAGIYGASKAAIHTMSQALAMELAPYGITVNCICPALANTEMHWVDLRKSAAEKDITFEEELENELPSIPLHRLGTGADSAGAILWLASEAGSYVTGQLININGGLDFS